MTRDTQAGGSNSGLRWWHVVFAMAVASTVLGFVAGIIDGHPFEMLSLDYAPRVWSARVIEAIRGVLLLLTVLAGGIFILRWGVRRLSR